MDGGSEQPSSLQSICHVRACELFPKRSLQAEDVHLSVPFVPVCGEGVEFLGRTADGILALSNYRLHLLLKDTYYNIPLGLIEVIEVKDIFSLHVGCKDARLFRCTFTTNEHCLDWFRRLHKATMSPSNIEDLFAFAFMAWSSEEGGEEVAARLGGNSDALTAVPSFQTEVERLRFDVNGAWRISQVPQDPTDPTRADRTVPSQLCIAKSGISGAGHGVWTRVPLAKGLRFGPYEGVKLESSNSNGYCWQFQNFSSHNSGGEDSDTVKCVTGSVGTPEPYTVSMPRTVALPTGCAMSIVQDMRKNRI